MNMPELLKCARSKGIKIGLPITRQELVNKINALNQWPTGVMRVHIPDTITNLIKIMPYLKQEYGGIIDFKLNGNLESMSLIPGNEAYVNSDDIPDYEVMWHNHPFPDSGTSIPSLSDIKLLINRQHTQYSLIFTDMGTFIQWVPDKEQARFYLKNFTSMYKTIVEQNAMFLNILFREDDPEVVNQYTDNVRKYFKVETRFIPWGQPVTLELTPYEPTIHKGRRRTVQPRRRI